jgi:DNA-binding MarR family transcriptional regulator
MIDRTARNDPVEEAGAALPATLERRITYLLRRVTDAAGRMANAHLEQLGLDTRHYTVLAVVAAGGGSSQRTIADTLRLDRATVVALVDALEVQGLARRVQSREDRRANAVELTPKGRRALKRADALMEECEAAFVATLREEERAQLQAILERLLTSARDMP